MHGCCMLMLSARLVLERDGRRLLDLLLQTRRHLPTTMVVTEMQSCGFCSFCAAHCLLFGSLNLLRSHGKRSDVPTPRVHSANHRSDTDRQRAWCSRVQATQLDPCDLRGPGDERAPCCASVSNCKDKSGVFPDSLAHCFVCIEPWDQLLIQPHSTTRVEPHPQELDTETQDLAVRFHPTSPSSSPDSAEGRGA